MALLAAGAAAVAATGISMYLDAKYSIRADIAQLQGAKHLQKFVEDLYKEHGEDDWSFYHVLHSTYAENHHTDKEAFVFEGRAWTYREFREEIGRLAEAFERLGINNRTVVGMFVNNSPEFVIAWWALYKLGAIAAPVNTSITGTHIKHCLKVSEAEFCITTYELYGTLIKALVRDESHPGSPTQESSPFPRVILYDYSSYAPIRADLQENVLLKHEELPPVTPEMADFPKHKRPKVGPTDAAQYLFTSGTTGMPKALIWPLGYNRLSGNPQRWPGMQGSHRRWYICLPMFHGTASFAALPGALASSGTVILARRFSRREFWADVRRSRANAILYIGEMFRYLVQSPPDPRFPDEKNHGVDLAFGLGLAPSVWRAVRERFGIPWIVEYYSASEATISLLNSNKNDLGVGKVARWGPIMRSKWFGQSAFQIIRADFETGEVVRDPKTGFCIKAKPGEVGEAISKIVPPIQRRHDYVGEGGVEATRKKSLRDVFEKGDEYTRIGDALVIDEDGFIQFRDRLGDTYRAKGHNISTTEVEAWLSRHPQITSVNVYAIPMNYYGYDGQLGCAAITLHGASPEQSDRAHQEIMSQLEHWLRTSESALPAYAVPRFVRILINDGAPQDSGGMSGDSGSERVSMIMKKLKTGLRKDGFLIPKGNKDRMFWIEKEGAGYTPLTDAAIQRLLSGKAQL
ncbi:uncharacterized protein Z519_01797 [Cladophialophora bantiana CBS 173.52]|uniref:AMP-dependent synthetase/ligase domain-containing protein n=1 Tax=Cladophialophora bantiana (strain ATCC 10958 / CBS 173.52 / CDC B-1940 / NIH 8579) TaxID=1442370 RepID=A0A0D2HXS4_CLAB1|nr:uncharacterized protein Z519_01797 [Cladophialophora bantiana CBS 173.52]KIW98213.1 hypothetical protein Z519_01797 [Cladophialophora bantiana CBS 173.52]